jgi:hypothetical protein
MPTIFIINVDSEGNHLSNTHTHTDSTGGWMLGLGLALLQPLPVIGQHFMGLGLLGQNGSTINLSEFMISVI